MRTVRGWLDQARWRLGGRARRLGVAWRYLAGRTTTDDGWTLFHAAQDVTGYYSLEGIGPDSVRSFLAEEYGERPELDEVVQRACARVASKWDSSGHITNEAEDWAMSMAREYLSDARILPLQLADLDDEVGA